MSACLSLIGRRRGGRLFEAGRLLTFSAFRIGAYSRWALIRGWALIRINTVFPWLFLSVVSVTRAVYFHVNVTCFAAKHLKFDSHYSNYRQEPISAPVVDTFLISAFRSSFRNEFHLQRNCSIGVKISLWD